MMRNWAPKDFKIFPIDNNEGFVAPARNLSISELHSEISFCNEIVRDAVKNCKGIVNMTPVNSQIHSPFGLAHKHLRAALDLGHSANVAVGAAHITVHDVGPVSLSLLECNLKNLKVDIKHLLLLLVKFLQMLFLQDW